MVKQIERDDPRLVFVPLDKATEPPGGLIEHFKDRFWAYDPDRGVIFWNPDKKRRDLFPQCNSQESIALDFNKRMYPWAEVKFLPSVFRRINPQDYC